MGCDPMGQVHSEKRTIREMSMSPSGQVTKVGLAFVRNERVLLVRKRGGKSFILPGGKPEGVEDDVQTLNRELREELGCEVTEASFEGVFYDAAADLRGTRVSVRLYTGRLQGQPTPSAEIEEARWFSLRSTPMRPVAPSLLNSILPHLRQLAGLPSTALTIAQSRSAALS